MQLNPSAATQTWASERLFACCLLTGLCRPSVSLLHGGWRSGAARRKIDGQAGRTVRCHVHWSTNRSIDDREQCCYRRDRRSPLSDGLQVSFSGLSNQMSDSPLRLCHAEMNVHAGTGAACANKDLNTEKNGPAQPSVRLWSSDHCRERERGHADLQVWRMGWVFLLGLTQRA